MAYNDGPVEDAPKRATLESLLNDLRGTRMNIQEQQQRQQRALGLLGFRPVPPAASQPPANGVPSNDALSVLAREVEALSYAANDISEYSLVLERQYSEKAGM
ncbi:MAG: hypothetical protein ACRYFX_18770 [Janthinobacterium lividum]